MSAGLAMNCGGGGGGGSTSNASPISLTEVGVTITISPTSLPSGTNGFAYTAQLSETGSSSTITWSVSQGTLPQGLTLNTATGLISGTPGVAGIFTFTITATDAQQNKGSQQYALALNSPAGGPIVIMMPSLMLNATEGSNFNNQLTASGGTPPFTWSISAGSLPAGLTFNGTGLLSGVPTASGTFSFTVRATDTTAAFGQAALTLTVVPPIVVSPTTLPNGIIGTAYSAQLSATGGTPPIKWSVSVGSLPAGLSLNSSTGLISGTPTAAGTVAFTVRATDSTGAFSDKPYALMIAVQIAITTASPLPNGSIGVAYSAQITTTGGNPPLAFTTSAGSLPPGLTLNGANGLISGTPGASGTFSFTVKVTDTSSAVAQTQFSLTITGGPTVSSVFPFSGNTSGGEPITVTGAQFMPGAALSLGGVSANVVSVSADGTTIQAITGAAPNLNGWVPALVTNPTTFSGTLQKGFFYGTSVGCGANCGNVGDPYEGQGPPSNQQPISSCNTNITGGGNFVLTQNIGSDPTTTCLKVFFPSAPVNLDLGGFTVMGQVDVSQTNQLGNIVQNGTINCSNGAGCLIYPTTGRIHHVIITNSAGLLGVLGSMGINVVGTESSSNPFLGLQIDHSSVTISATPNANRTQGINISGANAITTVRSMSVELNNNIITCADNASACQGIQFFASMGSWVHNNEFNLPANCPQCLDSARATIFDQTGVSEFSFNVVMTLANRGVRQRNPSTNTPGNQPISIHDNSFQDITNVGRFAAVHIGENDNDLNITPVDVFNNTFELGPQGAGVVVGSAINVTIHNNTVTCFSGDCTGAGFLAKTDVPNTTYGTSGTNMTVSNNNVSVLTTIGLPAVDVCQSGPSLTAGPGLSCSADPSLPLSTSATVCSSGNAIGNGTINLVNPPCP